MQHGKGIRHVVKSLPGFSSEEERIKQLEEIRAAGSSKEQVALFAARNFGLVLGVAGYYVRFYPELDFDDLCVEGYIGLIRATEKFDTHRGTTFSTYAMGWVRQSMLRAIHETMFVRPFRLTTAMEQDLMDLKRRVAQFAARHGGKAPSQAESMELTMEWITARRKKGAKPMRGSERKARALLELAGLHKEYMDAPLPSKNGDGGSRWEVVAHDGPSPDERAMHREAQAQSLCITERVARLLARLLDAAIISFPWHVEMYWQYMETDPADLSYPELGDLFGCSRQRVPQVVDGIGHRVLTQLGYSRDVVAAAAFLRAQCARYP